MKDIHKFNFPVEASYGVAEIRGNDNLIQVIKEAHERMYDFKKEILKRK